MTATEIILFVHEPDHSGIAVIVAIFAVLALLALFLGMIRDFISMISNIPAFQNRKFTDEEKMRLSSYLLKRNYFQKLTPEGKKRFMDRLVRFMINKQFIGREELEVTEEMRVQISASAIQLTFGLDEFIFPDFDRIFIYPEIFVAGYRGEKMKGGTTPNGIMMLSWKDFQSGNEDQADGINLGLHEFSHALKIELEEGSDYEKHFTATYPEWEQSGMDVMQKMRDGKSNVLRKYGSTNIHEFFAVSVEHFFERPAEFKSSLPDLYNHFLWLLNQDPLNDIDDYRCAIDSVKIGMLSPAQEPKIRDQWHWSLNILLSGIFFGTPALIFFASKNVISFSGILIFIIVFAAANRVTRSYFRERRILNELQFNLYSIIGIGIWATTFMLALNFFIPVGKPTIENYGVFSYMPSALGEKTWVRIDFDNGVYQSAPLLRTFHYNPSAGAPNEVYLTFRRGIFGIKSLRNSVIVTSNNVYSTE